MLVVEVARGNRGWQVLSRAQLLSLRDTIMSRHEC